MSSQERYEIKFILNDNELNEALNWIYCHANASVKHPSRIVNSLYFDNIEHQSIKDNLTGIANRNKTRLRWYHATQENMSIPVMEIKLKQGRLGKKIQYKLPQLQHQFFDLTFKDIANTIKTQLTNQNDGLEIFNEFLFPTLLVSYKRQYFENFSGVRVTIDSDIYFNDVPSFKKPGTTMNIFYPRKIMEIKFDPSKKNSVSKHLKTLHLYPKRHSKYLTGMAILGNVNYI